MITYFLIYYLTERFGIISIVVLCISIVTVITLSIFIPIYYSEYIGDKDLIPDKEGKITSKDGLFFLKLKKCLKRSIIVFIISLIFTIGTLSKKELLFLFSLNEINKYNKKSETKLDTKRTLKLIDTTIKKIEKYLEDNKK